MVILPSDLLKSNHPLHANFVQWCKGRGTEPQRRQAAKYLAAYPHYNRALAAAKSAAA